MILFCQPPWPADKKPHVFSGGAVEAEYPICLWVVDPEVGASRR